MGWVEIEKRRAGGGKKVGQVVTIAVRDGKVRVGLSGALLEKLGWKLGDHVKVLRGRGEHEGALRLDRGDAYVIRRRNSASGIGDVVFPAWAEIAEASQSAKVSEFRTPLINTDTEAASPHLVVTLPEWTALRPSVAPPSTSQPPAKPAKRTFAPIPLLK